MDELAWERPGPGTWNHFGDHFPGALTPIYRALHRGPLVEGIGDMFEFYGVPLRTVDERFVNGRVYSRLQPLIMADKDGNPPPGPILWLVTRLHPEFRRRNRNAAHVLETRPWLDATRKWNEEQRGERERRNLALQDEDLGSLDDAALIDHFRRATENVVDGHLLHFRLHGPDLMPIGLLLVAAQRWGLPSGAVLDTLQGWSPASAEPAQILGELGAMIGAASGGAGAVPGSLDDVRAVGPDAAAKLDLFLRLRGWHMITRYDIDGLALCELPEMVLSAILAPPVRPAPDRAEAALAALLARVPAGERAKAQQMVDEARAAYGLRDENGPYNVTWPNGLLRRALLEIAARLGTPDVFELELDEVGPLLLTGLGPSPAELAARAELRRHQSAGPAPPVLGPAEADPPTKWMPGPMRTATEVASTAYRSLGTSREGERPLHGLGVGDSPYVGRACVARDPEEALTRLQHGDVLVTPMTTPAYNAVLPLAGAVVVEEGGPLCHAAVIAGELGIPALIGVSEALARINDGDVVEVDPAAGVVRLRSTVAVDAFLARNWRSDRHFRAKNQQEGANDDRVQLR